MKSYGSLLFLALLLTAPLYAQSEAHLQQAFVGKTVVPKMDMPGASAGINIRPENTPPTDASEQARLFSNYEVGAKAGAPIKLTKIKVKDDLIEIHLGAGGFSTWSGQPQPPTATPKSEQEFGLEVAYGAETDRAKKAELRKQIETLQRQRAAQDQRARERYDRAMEAYRQGQRDSGSRFNLRFKKKVPPDALTPEGFRNYLAPYLEFDAPSSTLAINQPPPAVANPQGNRSTANTPPLNTNFSSATPSVNNPPVVSNEPRFALVIGNSAYKTISPLVSPINDANDMARTLAHLGFQVVKLENQTQRAMKSAIRELGNQLSKGGVGLFFFAGHGVQMNGVNYLLPVDADIAKEHEVEDQGVSMNLVMGELESARNRMNIVILDACRDNPFASRFRSATRGLAIIKNAPTETYIAFSTQPGEKAREDDRNGIYTQELLKHIQTPGLSIEDVFKRVRAGVLQKTQGVQQPWESSSITGAFYFAPPRN
ncbi:MAG TPA: caspase family protein [Blastocatellia bacterium]|nr:caspase family protein [Blastocatellia bacterium]